MRATAVIALGLLLAAPAQGGDDAPKPPAAPAAPAASPVPPPPPEQAADAVLAAVQAKDSAALQTLAARDDPDSWLVADELIRRGEFNAADAFARAAPRVDVEGLPGYVASRQGKPDDAARRDRLARERRAHEARNPTAALEALGPAEPGPIEDVVGVRMAQGRGVALRALARLEESHAVLLGAAEAAERFGWLAGAVWAYHVAGNSAFRGSAYAAALTAWERRLALCERRGDGVGAAGAINDIGSVHFSRGALMRHGKCQSRMHVALRPTCCRLGPSASWPGEALC